MRRIQVATDDDLDDSEFDKIVGQYRLALNDLMRTLYIYGLNIYVDGMKESLVSLAIQMHLRLSGVDIPYEVEHSAHW